MEWFAGRENQFNDSLAGRVSNFMLSTAMADGMARMQDARILAEILKLPNVEASQTIDVLDEEKPLVYKANIPAAMLAELRPFLAERAELNMSMTVGAQAEEASQVNTDTTVEASGSGGFLFWKMSMSMKANVSTSNSQKRSSDYSATTDMKLIMSRHDLPEGVAIIKNGMEEIARGANQLIVAKNNQRLQEMNNEGKPLPDKVEKPGEQAS